MPLPKNRIVPSQKIYFRSEIQHCPFCGTKLKHSHTVWKKNVSTLSDVIQAWNMAYICPNTECSHPNVRCKSAEQGYHQRGKAQYS